MRTLSLMSIFAGSMVLTLSGCTGDAGPAGRDGVATTSVNGISPARAFIGRKATITISGFGTSWDKANKPKVDFGDPAITVAPDDVSVASPTALVVVANIGVGAKVEKKTIKVGDKDSFEGFSVESPVDVVTEGVVAQGSIVKVTFKNRDLAENLFDDTSVSTGIFSPPEFTNFAIEPGKGGAVSDKVRVILQGVTPFKGDAILLSDVTIPAEKLDILVKSGPVDSALDFAAPGAFDIKARTATPVTSGTPAAGEVKNAYDSGLYSFSSAAGDTLNFIGVGGRIPADASPSVFRLPQSGSFKDLGSAGYYIGSAATPSYVVFWDGSGSKGYNYNVVARSTAATVLAEPASNDTAAAALAVTAFPSIVKAAELSSATDVDFFKVDVAANKKLVFGTLPGDEACDTIVTIYKADGTTAVLEEPADADFHESVTTDALDAGTYYVKVSAGRGWKAASKKYAAYITVE
jgi:hypothetical protein